MEIRKTCMKNSAHLRMAWSHLYYSTHLPIQHQIHSPQSRIQAVAVAAAASTAQTVSTETPQPPLYPNYNLKSPNFPIESWEKLDEEEVWKLLWRNWQRKIVDFKMKANRRCSSLRGLPNGFFKPLTDNLKTWFYTKEIRLEDIRTSKEKQHI